MKKSKKVPTTAQRALVEVTDWATAEFWVEYLIQFGKTRFEVAVEYDERDGFQVSAKEVGTDKEFGGDELATMLGYRDEMDLCDDLTQGMFAVPERRFVLTVGGKEVTA